MAVLFATVAGAQEPSAADIVRALKPSAPTFDRSVNRQILIEPKPSAAASEPAPPSAQIAAAPSISLTIPFAYNSAELAPAAASIMQKLAAALRDRALASFQFEIAGHTDAVGGAEYNLALSERRADAVRTYLVKVYGIASERLVAHGYGKTRLTDPAHPQDGVNRRVEIVNLGVTSASK